MTYFFSFGLITRTTRWISFQIKVKKKTREIQQRHNFQNKITQEETDSPETTIVNTKELTENAQISLIDSTSDAIY